VDGYLQGTLAVSAMLICITCANTSMAKIFRRRNICRVSVRSCACSRTRQCGQTIQLETRCPWNRYVGKELRHVLGSADWMWRPWFERNSHWK
jgi:hypothetical protein